MIVKKASDYYEKLYEMFPDVPKQDIRQILNYGLKQLYLHNSFGGDTLIQDHDFWCYIGLLTNDSIKHEIYYIDKLCMKMRILFNKKRIEWDGCYYFSPTNEQSEAFLNGELDNFSNIMLYKIKDECILRRKQNKYVFKIQGLENQGFDVYRPEMPKDNVEFVLQHEPLKFKDILASTKKYDII